MNVMTRPPSATPHERPPRARRSRRRVAALVGLVVVGVVVILAALPGGGDAGRNGATPYVRRGRGRPTEDALRREGRLVDTGPG